MQDGRVLTVIGPVVDVEFPSEHLPDIYNALHVIDEKDQTVQLVLEAVQHIGDNVVRVCGHGCHRWIGTWDESR